MSKASSGHFKNTAGARHSSRNLSQNSDQRIIISTSAFDKREHPTKYQQLSSKQKKRLQDKLNSRTISREEYKRLSSNKRLNKRRTDGIIAFWENEKLLISHNLPTTRNWSSQQRQDILNDKRPKYKGVPMQSHHTFSVARYPHLANIGELIYPATHHEHFNRWHGRNYRNGQPGHPANAKVKEEF